MPVQVNPFLSYESPYPDKTLVMTGEKFQEMLNFLECSPVTVFDHETSGLEWFKDSKSCGLALGGFDRSTGRAHSYYVPYRHRTGESQLDLGIIAPVLKRLLADETKTKVAHNLKFDEHFSRREGWQVRGSRYDTMIAARLFDENRPLALKTRAEQDLGRHDADEWETLVNREVFKLARIHRMKKSEYKAKYGYSQVAIPILGIYSCLDVEFTLQLYSLYEKAEVSKTYPRIWDTEMRLTEALCDMEEAGLPIDVDYLENLRDSLHGVKTGLEMEIERLLGRKIKLGSDDELRNFMVDDLGLNLTKLTQAKAISVDKEVLESFQAHHPAIKLIMDWREAEKLHNTYTTSILQRLDDKNVLHADFQQVGASTGRLSCRQPNFQNMPTDDDDRAEKFCGKDLEHGGVDPWSIRRAFVNRGPGWVRLFFDYCLAPSTKVETVDGLKAIGKLKAGNKVFTERGGRIAWGEVSRTARVGKLPAYRVTFDDGGSVVAARDHKWPVQIVKKGSGCPLSREVRATFELSAGDRMVPMRRSYAGPHEYPTLYSRSTYQYVYEHKLVAAAVLGSCPSGCEVHHKNENQRDNRGVNLEYVEIGKHRRAHARESYKKQDHDYRREKLREGLKRRRSYVGKNNPNYGRRKGKNKRCRNCRKSFYRPPSRLQEYCSRDCYWESRRGGKNHKVVSVEYLGKREMVAITVEPDHNFVLGCGVVTMNSQIELRVLAYYTKDPVMVDNYLKGGDIHERTSLEVFESKEKKHRRFSKVINFGLAYCLTDVGLSRQAKIPMSEAKKFMDKFFQRYIGVSVFCKRFWGQVRAQGCRFQNLFGRPRRVPHIVSPNDYHRGRGERQAIATLIQGTAAELIKESMVRVHTRFKQEGLPAYQVNVVHDEIQVDCHTDSLVSVCNVLKEEMERFPEFSPIPIVVDGEYSVKSWADKKSLPL